MLVGVVIGAFLFSGVAYASSKLTVDIFDLKFMVSGVEKTTANGKYNNGVTEVPLGLVYKGTSYIPIRYASEILNEKITWEGSTKTIHLGDEIKGTGTYLTDIVPDKANRIYINDPGVRVGGQKYSETITFGTTHRHSFFDALYNLNGKYTEFSFTVAHDDSSNRELSVVISGDNRILWKKDLPRGSKPEDVTLDLTGVLSLEIKVIDNIVTSGTTRYINLINPVLR